MTAERQIKNPQDLFECLNAADSHLVDAQEGRVGDEEGISQARDRLSQAMEFINFVGLDKLLGECIGLPAEFELTFARVDEGTPFHARVWFVDSHDIPHALRVKGTDPRAVVEALSPPWPLCSRDD